jgi:uncharacterized lipoprotein YddW (UPF0748 family)
MLSLKTCLCTGIVCLLLGAVPTFAQRAPNLARSLSTAVGAEGRLLWIDATANFWRKKRVNGKDEMLPYTITREGINEIVRNAKKAHVNTLVVDVKPVVGSVVYKSEIAPRLRSWLGKDIPDIDILQAFVEEGHKVGMRVHASFNILAEGHKYYKVGLAYEHTDWQSVVYSVNRGMLVQTGARLSFRVPKEPDATTKPLLITDDTQDAGIERIGLDRPDGAELGTGSKTFGKKLLISIDANNRVEGIADAALLGEEALAPPEEGRMLIATEEEDRQWCVQNLDLGTLLTYDLRHELLPIADAKSEKVACFINPLHPEARKHQIDLLKEVVTNYDVDGVVLDRCRFSNIYNDFSDLTRQAFARWLGKPVSRWPQDVFSFSPQPGKKVIPGPYYKQWLEFRAQVIRDFVGEVARAVKGLKPQISLGAYVGAWYPTYYEVGVNWGSEKTPLRYSWFTDEYPRTGYADFMDWIALGSYHPFPRKVDAKRAGKHVTGSVEGLTEIGTTAVANSTFTFGSIFVPDYKNDPEMMANALQAASQQGQGWMIFDLTYIEEFNFWNVIEAVTKSDAPAPDAFPNLLATIRRAMDVVR